MTNSPRRLLFLGLIAVVACAPPNVGSSGGGGAGSGEDNRGGSDNGSGGESGRTDGGFTLPDMRPAKDGPGAELGPSTGPTCAEEAHDGKLVPVDLLLLVDTSGSMEESAGTQSKWRAVHDALQTFLKDPKSAGLGVGLQRFPPPPKPCATDDDCPDGWGLCEAKGACAMPANVSTVTDTCNANVQKVCPRSFISVDGPPCTKFGTCAKSGLRCAGIGQACPGGAAGDTCTPRAQFCSDNDPAYCAPTHYETLAVPIADLPGVQGALSVALGAIVPQGGTPTLPAVEGALAHLRARAATTPGRKPVLVLATDGLPSGCVRNNPDTASAALRAGFTGTPSIPTYVIGVFHMSQLGQSGTALNQLAAGGGTMTPFVLTTGADLSMKFLDAINQIRGAAVGCEFTIPMPAKGTIDFDKVNVRYKEGATAGEELRYVGSADKCDPTKGGWYYDQSPTMGRPTRVLLCPATCKRVGASAGASVELRFGCQTRID
jgi:hypothetical protein